MDSREAQYRNPAGEGDAGKNRGGDYEAGFSTVGAEFGKCWNVNTRIALSATDDRAMRSTNCPFSFLRQAAMFGLKLLEVSRSIAILRA